ncbi:NYN domain-containing protein [Arthrobacter sp. SAFR-044]|uniref:NYN domain-containing protein n=1 Tax=Arthrobacter sp. SAFR-044 TaxID=3387278 RepID=UPI003F7CBFF8
MDGSNLYRRLLQGHPQDKWLNLEAMAEFLLPEFDLSRVRYFTAIVKPIPGSDPQTRQRQQAHVRALETLSRTSVPLGKYRVDPRIMPVHPTAYNPDGTPQTVKVKKTEEKGSDVSLASHLLLDGFNDDADTYVICTNDSDLVTPLRMVRFDLGKQTGLLSPMEPKRASNELKQTNPSLHRQVTLDSLGCEPTAGQTT